MIYDGIFIKAQVNEISKEIKNERITKIIQKSQKEINFFIRKNGKDLILTLNADANFPHILLDENYTENKNIPPAFCMLMRKYIQSGIIKKIESGNPFFKQNNNSDLSDFRNQANNSIDLILKNNYSLERIINIEIENIDDNGDINTYHIFFEIMGKYSNIIITTSDFTILDILIKDKNENARLKQKEKYETSSVCNKNEILTENEQNFNKTINNYKALCEINNEIFDYNIAISKNYAGISTNSLKEIIVRDNLNYDKDSIKLKTENFQNLNDIKDFIIKKIETYSNTNQIVIDHIKEHFTKMNDSTEKKNIENIINTLYSKLIKKLDIYNKDLSKCEDLEKYKLYGDLISAFGYNNELIKDNILTCENYHDDNKIINIPLYEGLSIPENVNKYYNKYNKLKRTKEKTSELIYELNIKLEHLDSIKSSTTYSNEKNDIYLIKEEILNYFDEANALNFIKNQNKTLKNKNTKSKKTKNTQKINYNIHHYKSSTGIDIYLGKNNLQNEYLTFTMATPSDTWLHIKNATGSHVIVKKSYENLDDKTLIEAASLAAYFSDKRNETKTTVDYTLRKELKKVKGKAPGFCIYHKNYSINVKPEILIKEI